MAETYAAAADASLGATFRQGETPSIRCATRGVERSSVSAAVCGGASTRASHRLLEVAVSMGQTSVGGKS